ncbi:Cerato-platanin [Gloeophyllum trabeum ATCC 11539]|uniref:Cerato-platanin n=1 Tax=Gloeophyllum trabeum (strain ATCC 11539 / FP-39264 / Madison 617) TaxID=670483 RepID=S7RV92_GLOTA|nr:Cerato-platanin [Gloeophyllum trabeum ATCC 11539]EPQ58695.1 Cerato-platanin [Gloeophyllum trabeum ATCC 11539]
MKFIALLATLTALPAALSQQVSWDSVYDNANQSLATVACSDGTNGLLTKGYTTFGSLPSFPYIGGAQAVAGWNSAACGTCWNITYGTTTITVLAVDHAGSGFNIGETAMNTLTGGHAVEYGIVQAASSTQVPAAACGL